MTMILRRTVTAAFAAAGLGLSALTLPASGAWAQNAPAQAKAGEITVSDAWARASAGMARAGGGFMTLSNAGSVADRLVAAKADVSDITELHTHIRDGDVMRMRPVDAIDLPAGGSVSLQPGGLHVMFIGLKAPLREGQHFPLTLTFEKGGETTIDVVVKKAGAMGMKQGSMKQDSMTHGAMPGMGKKPAN